jgi:hypothetical protein
MSSHRQEFPSAKHRAASKSVGPTTWFVQLCLVLMAELAQGALAAQAQPQAVVADATYTATVDNTMDSHYRVSPLAGARSNWRSPVDYATSRAAEPIWGHLYTAHDVARGYA